MGEQDYAILVGISRYGAQGFLGKLDGPPNDLQHMKKWLMARDGGNVPKENILINATPDPFEAGDPAQWTPTEADYLSVYRAITQDNEGKAIKRNARLYLYFSGHGFSERRDQFTQAAVFAANATKLYPENICGTFFANVARDKGFFKEVVLIMDCCRDSELSYPFSRPAINSSPDDGQQARVLAIYGAPKGGQAQEREIPELGGKTHGILTHALVQALTLAPADENGRVSATALKEYVRANWGNARGDTEAPWPQMLLPLDEEIFFNSIAGLVKQAFVLPQAMPEIATHKAGSAAQLDVVKIEVFNAAKRKVATVEIESFLIAPVGSVTWDGKAAGPISIENRRFELRLSDTLYRYVATGAITRRGAFQAGEADVEF